jgi:hypothetical protein
MEMLRRELLDRHGTIDIQEALYLGGKAVVVAIPVLFLWFVLQVISAILFVCNRKGARWSAWLLFMALWAVAWGMCLI